MQAGAYAWHNRLHEAPSYPILPQPTLDFSSILPHPTLSYPIIHSFTFYPTTHSNSTFFVLHCIVQPSYLIVLYHTSYHSLHWSVHPFYPILPQPSSSYTGLFSHPTLAYPILHPFYTGLFTHPTLYNHNLLPPTRVFNQISHHNLLRPTLDFLNHPTLEYTSIHPYQTAYTSYTGLFLPQMFTPSYQNLFRPTLDCSAILPYATPSYHNLLRPPQANLPRAYPRVVYREAVFSSPDPTPRSM